MVAITGELVLSVGTPRRGSREASDCSEGCFELGDTAERALRGLERRGDDGMGKPKARGEAAGECDEVKADMERSSQTTPYQTCTAWCTDMKMQPVIG